jgi:hypothetical protein
MRTSASAWLAQLQAVNVTRLFLAVSLIKINQRPRTAINQGVMSMAKMRTPSEADKKNAERWLLEAQHNLKRNEYHRIKQLCKQVIRALRRKETEA